MLVSAVCGDFTSLARGGAAHNHEHNLPRTGRQESEPTPGGVDFSGCVTDPDTGLCCVDKEETVTSLEKEPILECTHKNTEQCHYTYVTQFTPSQEEVSANIRLSLISSESLSFYSLACLMNTSFVQILFMLLQNDFLSYST